MVKMGATVAGQDHFFNVSKWPGPCWAYCIKFCVQVSIANLPIYSCSAAPEIGNRQKTSFYSRAKEAGLTNLPCFKELLKRVNSFVNNLPAMDNVTVAVC